MRNRSTKEMDARNGMKERSIMHRNIKKRKVFEDHQNRKEGKQEKSR